MTTTVTQNNVNALEGALGIINGTTLRFHTEPVSIKYTNRQKSLETLGLTNQSSFYDLVFNIMTEHGGRFDRHFSVNIKGVLLLAGALYTDGMLSGCQIGTEDRWENIDAFDRGNVNLMMKAYTPWTQLPLKASRLETAARLYQRRIRKGKSTQDAYRSLATHIIRNAIARGEAAGYNFTPAREDLRAAVQ